jgi:quinol monooxygenase YgiN
LPRIRDFTQATREETGNLWFEWSRNVEDPNQFVPIEGFRDADAGTQHVNSAHIKEATKQVPSMLAHTPKVLYTELPGTEWSLLVGDVGVRQRTDLIERWRPNRRITVRSKRVHAPIDTISGREQLERPISVASQSFLLISIG